MLSPLIKRQFLFTVSVFVVVLVVVHFASRALIRLDRVDILQHQADLITFTLMETKGDRVETLKRINELNEKNGGPFGADLIQDNKSLLTRKPYIAPTHFEGPFPLERAFVFPGDHKTQLVIRVGPKPEGMVWIILPVVLFLAILLASFLSVFFFFWRFRSKAETAKSVLLRMQRGDLKARFPLSKWDDAVQILRLFNEMADEIERLVERLRGNEKSRMQLLGDIAHDLRTPIASLHTVIEGLHDSAESMSTKDRQEYTEMALKETEYLERLVEDLLFLGLVIEPKYKSEATDIAIQELVRSQLPAVQARYPEINLLKVLGIPLHLSEITGNAHLLSRLMRNALENSFSFAKSEVLIMVSVKGDWVEVLIADDGPGFSREALENFGKKRATRYLNEGQATRLSVGLGSVIMKAIVNAHGGTIVPENRIGEKGAVVGGQIRITLHRSSQSVHAQRPKLVQ